MSIVLFAFLVIVLAILLILAVDYLGGAAGGDARLYLLLKALVVIGAVIVIAQRAGLF